MIEFIDLTSKQTSAEMAAPTPVPPPPKDYVTSQLEAMGQAIKNSLDRQQQFQCLYEMNNILYRHVTQAQFPNQQGQYPMQNQQNYAGGNGQGGGQGDTMREFNFHTT